MKKIIALAFCVATFVSFNGFSQTTPPAVAAVPPAAVIQLDSIALKEFVGKFKMKGAPFENVIVTVKDGKLWGEAEGQGSAELAPTKDVDNFEVVGYGGSVVFVRGDDKKIKGLQLTLQGSTLEGEKAL